MALNFHNQKTSNSDGKIYAQNDAIYGSDARFPELQIVCKEAQKPQPIEHTQKTARILNFPQPVDSVAQQAVEDGSDHKLTTPQTRIYTSVAKYTCGVAGMGSGKTEAAINRILTTKLMYPSIDLAYLAPTYQLISDIFYPRMIVLLTQMGIRHRINKKENIIHIQGHGQIYCRSMDKPEYIIGWEVGDAFLDEFDVLKTEKAMVVLNKITARCRQSFPDGKLNQLFFTTTPEGFKATYELFKKPDTKLDNSNLIQMSTYSNAHNLPPNYIEDLRKQYPKNLIEAYLMGVFVNLTSGSVYTSYDRELNRSSEIIRVSEPLHVGMDFNVRRMCAAIFVRREGSSHAVEEVVNAYDTRKMIGILKERYMGHHITIYPDATGRKVSSTNSTESDHILLRDAGFALRVDEINPPVKNRVAACNNGFEKKTTYVNDSTCPHLAGKLEQQVWSDAGMPEKDGTEDILDAYGYYVAKKHELREEVRYNYMQRQRRAVGCN